MAKREKQLLPWPETVWHTAGRVKGSSWVAKTRRHIRESVDEGVLAHWAEFDPKSEGWWHQGAWWGFDAAYETPDGAHVRARLLMSPDKYLVDTRGLTRSRVEAGVIDMDVSWVLTCEADRPWNKDWIAPSRLLLPDGAWLYDWVTGQMPMLKPTSFAELPTEVLAGLLDQLSAAPWHITVITHDRNAPVQAETEDGHPMKVAGVPGLVAPSLQTRVLEIRVHGQQDQIVNTALNNHQGVYLNVGGALILPTRPRPEGWPLENYMITRPRGGDMEVLIKEAAEAVSRYAELPPHFNQHVRTSVEDLRHDWPLPEIQPSAQRLQAEKQQALDTAEALRGQLADLRGVLDDERRTNHLRAQALKEAREELRKAVDSPLVEQAREDRQQAETAWALQDAADAEVERLTRQVAYLRRQLAQVPGHTYEEEIPEQQDGPESWEELFALAGELLEHVRILDIVPGQVEKLRGHVTEKVWLRRAWESLESLNAYADAKADIGPLVLPHFSAYLDWEHAKEVIPKTWWCPAEATLERGGADLKVRRTRLFFVPELGETFMGAHIRVGSGRYPAPRMHLYDDTTGKTGRIQIGYLGPHLPNAKGR